jgi:hypothetical protein
LNYITYPEHEINMSNSVHPTEHDLHMYAKFGGLTCYEIFVSKYSKIWFLGILYKEIMYKMEFGQAYWIDLLKRIIRKLIWYFFVLHNLLWIFEV